MGQCRLRVYYGPSDETTATQEQMIDKPEKGVTVSLGDILPLLADAVRGKRGWVRDFADDEIIVSSDLYEILMAYQEFQRPTA